jgi:hypothetical protein
MGPAGPPGEVTAAQLAAVLARVENLERSSLHVWSRRVGSEGHEVPHRVALDKDGDLLVTGAFVGITDFGGGQVESAGLDDVFVAKYSGVNGAHQWSRFFGADRHDVARGIAVDAAGNVVVTGTFTGAVDFGGGPLGIGGGTFLARYSGTDGTHLWSRRLDGAASDIAVDASGSVFVTGWFNGTADLGGGPLASAGEGDVYVARYSGADGAHLWSRRYGGTMDEESRALAVDGSGGVFVTGWFTGPADFGGDPLVPAGLFDVFLAKLSGADGTHLWSRGFGGSDFDLSEALAVDAKGNVFLNGCFHATGDYGGAALVSAGLSDVFLAKYSGADGSHLWSRRFGGTSFDEGYGVAVDRNGNVAITGSFDAPVDFGGGPVGAAPAPTSIFVAKYAGTDGTHLWSRGFGSSSHYSSGRAIAVDEAGHVVATGQFRGSVDFGGGPLASATDSYDDMFLLRLRP